MAYDSLYANFTADSTEYFVISIFLTFSVEKYPSKYFLKNISAANRKQLAFFFTIVIKFHFFCSRKWTQQQKNFIAARRKLTPSRFLALYERWLCHSYTTDTIRHFLLDLKLFNLNTEESSHFHRFVDCSNKTIQFFRFKLGPQRLNDTQIIGALSG